MAAPNNTITTPSGEVIPYGYAKSDTVSKFWRGTLSPMHLARLVLTEDLEPYVLPVLLPPPLSDF